MNNLWVKLKTINIFLKLPMAAILLSLVLASFKNPFSSLQPHHHSSSKLDFLFFEKSIPLKSKFFLEF